jgi:hypothetical protein
MPQSYKTSGLLWCLNHNLLSTSFISFLSYTTHYSWHSSLFYNYFICNTHSITKSTEGKGPMRSRWNSQRQFSNSSWKLHHVQCVTFIHNMITCLKVTNKFIHTQDYGNNSTYGTHHSPHWHFSPFVLFTSYRTWIHIIFDTADNGHGWDYTSPIFGAWIRLNMNCYARLQSIISGNHL